MPLNHPLVRHTGLALVTFAALAIFWTWPVAATLSTRIAHDPGDPVLNTWILWWNSQTIPLTGRWWNAPFFVPLPGALALSEHLLGISLIATPMQLAGANPIAAYNVSVLLSYTLSGLFGYLLAYRLTGSVLAAGCAGLAFGFAPYRAGQLGHIQVLASQWMPALLLGMHGYVESGRRRWLVLFGVSWLLQALSNGYYMLFLPALIVPWIAWFTPWRSAPRRALILVVAWVVFSLPLLPVLLKYQAVHTALGLARSLGDIRQFSATAGSFAKAPPLLALWPAAKSASPEDYLFPGLVVVILAAAGVLATAFRRRQAWSADGSRILFYGSAACLMFVLALGPGGEPDGPPSLLRPYTWLLALPGYDGLRVPARFAMPGVLCLALAAACSLAPFLRGGGRWRTAVAVAALAGISLDGLTGRVPVVVPPQQVAIPEMADAAVIEIPTDYPRVSASAMYRARLHRRPLINGYSGHRPYHYRILSLALRRGDPTVLTYLARERPLVIVVHTAADRGGFRKLIEALPPVSLVNISGSGPVYLLPRQPQRGHPAPAGDVLPVTARIESRRIVLDVGSPRSVSAIEFPLRGRYANLDERILIEASDDGEQWREAWLGWTGELALDAALRDPLVAPVRIPLPATRTRYLRIYPASAWLGEEIAVRGQ